MLGAHVGVEKLGKPGLVMLEYREAVIARCPRRFIGNSRRASEIWRRRGGDFMRLRHYLLMVALAKAAYRKASRHRRRGA